VPVAARPGARRPARPIRPAQPARPAHLARRARVLLAAAALAIALAGCQAQLDAAIEPGDTQVLVGRGPGGLTVEAPEWRPPGTVAWLCPAPPPNVFEARGPLAAIPVPPDCRAYGPFDSSRGLAASLRFGSLDAARRALFEAAPEWHLVLLGVRDGDVERVFRTVVGATAIDPAITPGPGDPLSPAPNPSGSAAP